MDNKIELWGIKDIMAYTGVGRPSAERYAKESGLSLPRMKGGPWRVPAQAFTEWFKGRKD